jgi:hypothetical protein
MSVRRVRVAWTGDPTAGGGLSTFYFNDAVGTAAQCVSAVGTFLTATNDRRVTTCGWATEADVPTLNVGTGVIESITSTTPATGTGSAAGDALPPIAQGLLRLFTSQIVSGRLLRGRLFLPGAPESDSASTGGTSSTFRSDYEAAAAALIADANADWSVWSQTHGTLASISTATIWTKWASMRSRRD